MDPDKAVIVLGQDIRKIPCFRNTFLYGISSGVAASLGTFLFTSKSNLAVHFGFWTYMVVGLGYWVQCRVKHVNDLFNSNQLQDTVEQGTLLQGTKEFSEEGLKNILKDA